MKVLFIQSFPCIRNWKLANVLHDAGHEVYLGQMVNAIDSHWGLPLECYKEVFFLSSFVGLNGIINYFDIVHCHNEPDWWTVFAIAAARGTGPNRVKVVHDCHDWIPGRSEVGIDVLASAIAANTLADICVYVSDVQRDLVARNTGSLQSPALVIPNYPLASAIPDDNQLLPKLSARDGKKHLVYSGTIMDRPGSHRCFVDEFSDIMKAGFNVHIYAPRVPDGYVKLQRGFRESMHIHGNQPYPHLIHELTQYDAGLVPFRKGGPADQHLDTGLPNKAFEYLAAGIPIACRSGLKQMNEFMLSQASPVGFQYSTVDDIKRGMAATYAGIDRHAFVFDDVVKKVLLPVYEQQGRHLQYTMVKSGQLMTPTKEMIDMQCFEGHGFECALYGRNHAKDLVFESYLAEERAMAAESAVAESKGNV